jgi:hypothetical protein
MDPIAPGHPMTKTQTSELTETCELTKEQEVSIQQHCALRFLAQGKSIAMTARLIGMTRATIHNWLRNDPQFIAAFNAWKNELRTSTQARLAVLWDKAVDVVEADISHGDGKMAMKLLTGMGMVAPQKLDPEDPQEVVIQQELNRRRRELELKQAAIALAELGATAPIDPVPQQGALPPSKV